MALLGGAALLLPANIAVAHERDHPAPVDCTTVRMALPPELAGWGSGGPAKAAKSRGSVATASLTVGRGVDATLSPTKKVRYVLRPEKTGMAGSYGGMFSFSVQEAGTYRVALGSGAWIDVVRGGKAVASSAHGHGPQCTQVRKMVDFPLSPGRHVLQIAASHSDDVPVMIARLPQ